jgi:nitroimidazol reductase NimA-like FMN-containing flavoprotein (pyridoxamine 5'-phosphate oxidase superfamily)
MNGAADRPAELFALDAAACLTLLRTQHVGRLVTTGVQARVVPVNYVVVDGVVVFRTAAGSDAARRVGTTALFEVDMFDDRTHSGWSVVVRGPLQPVPDGLDPVAIESWAPGERDAWLTVSVDEISGRLLRGAVEAPPRAPGGYL